MSDQAYFSQYWIQNKPRLQRTHHQYYLTNREERLAWQKNYNKIHPKPKARYVCKTCGRIMPNGRVALNHADLLGHKIVKERCS